MHQKERRNRPLVVALGVFLLAVPTVFTVFPGLSESSRMRRGLLLAAWFIAAAIAIHSSTKRDEAIQSLSDEERERQQKLRRAAALELMSALLRPGTLGIPSHYEFTVYIFDDDKLLPAWPVLDSDSLDPRIFSPGSGATGTAWADKEMVVVTGSAVANADYGLTPDQQEFFKQYKTAVATPISREDETFFGVLTALAEVDDQYFSGDGPGQRFLRDLSDVMGVLLTTILKPKDFV